MGIRDSKTKSFLGADKISLFIHLLYGQSCFAPTVSLSLQMSVFSLSRSVLSGVVALAVASASEERAKESECLLFVSNVSKPPTIFFLLINLLTPPYCVHFWGRWEEGVQQVGKERQLTTGDLSSAARGLIMLFLIFCLHVQFAHKCTPTGLAMRSAFAQIFNLNYQYCYTVIRIHFTAGEFSFCHQHGTGNIGELVKLGAGSKCDSAHFQTLC